MDKDRIFLKNIYLGSDQEDFIKEFVVYLKDAIKENRWDAMSDHQLYLRGAKRAIEEIISEMENVIKSLEKEEAHNG